SVDTLAIYGVRAFAAAPALPKCYLGLNQARIGPRSARLQPDCNRFATLQLVETAPGRSAPAARAHCALGSSRPWRDAWVQNRTPSWDRLSRRRRDCQRRRL